MTNKTISLYKVFREMGEGDVWKTSYAGSGVRVECTGEYLDIYEWDEVTPEFLAESFKKTSFDIGQAVDFVEEWERF